MCIVHGRWKELSCSLQCLYLKWIFRIFWICQFCGGGPGLLDRTDGFCTRFYLYLYLYLKGCASSPVAGQVRLTARAGTQLRRQQVALTPSCCTSWDMFAPSTQILGGSYQAISPPSPAASTSRIMSVLSCGGCEGGWDGRADAVVWLCCPCLSLSDVRSQAVSLSPPVPPALPSSRDWPSRREKELFAKRDFSLWQCFWPAWWTGPMTSSCPWSRSRRR